MTQRFAYREVHAKSERRARTTFKKRYGGHPLHVRSAAGGSTAGGFVAVGPWPGRPEFALPRNFLVLPIA